MEWYESILFGLISGLTEILPVSAQAHQTLLLKLFGDSDSPVQRLMIHVAVLLALYGSLREQIRRLLQERRLFRVPARRRKRQPDMQRVLDLRLVSTALVFLLLGFAAYPALGSWRMDLSKCAILLVVNGLLVYIPMHVRIGNKDSRSMSQLDGVLLGIFGGAAVLPGISRVGAITSAGVLRGASKENALHWALLLSIPALVALIGFDLYEIIFLNAATFSVPMLISGILAAAAAFGGATVGISIMRFMAVDMGFSGFAYYCWGTAMFSFIMYLTI